MNDVRLNLARKWRSKNFDSIIGQSLSIRMLKNSLYLDQFFPVYLFSGQRGCGKTTTARVFAAAVNCEQLSDFRKSPKNSIIPCGTCASCLAMLGGKHPDFIEIDAASHTGVDNVRSIIEASSLLPLLGRKKIYLIDEAHMLSKAAFNAFLKILEEPPASVLFILATTDPQKIIETVRSRCFQLFFTSVAAPDLQQHLVQVCQAEGIAFEDTALQLIIQESEGSVRDALNLLEQVRFSAPEVTTQAVLKSLGQLSDEQLLSLFDCVVHQGSRQLLLLLSEIGFDRYSADKFFGSFLELVRTSIWLKHGVKLPTIFDSAALEKSITTVALDRLTSMFQTLCEYEMVLAKTTKKHRMLEMILLKLCAGSFQHLTTPKKSNHNVTPSVAKPTVDSVLPPSVEKLEDASPTNTSHTISSAPWEHFLTKIDTLNDQLLKSIFVQATYDSVDDDKRVTVYCPERLSFFSDVLNESSSVWLPLLVSAFGEGATLSFIFKKNEPVAKSEGQPESAIDQKKNESGLSDKAETVKKSFSSQTSSSKKGRSIDISDTQTWQKTALVLKYFPGTITEITEA